MQQQSTEDVARKLIDRAASGEAVSPAEYRRLFILGLGTLLREVNSISFRLKEREQDRVSHSDVREGWKR